MAWSGCAIMTATRQPEGTPPPASLRHRVGRGLVVGVLLALVPKCGVCLLTYLGMGALLGLGGPELCGAADDSSGVFLTIASAVAFTLLAGALFCTWRRHAGNRTGG